MTNLKTFILFFVWAVFSFFYFQLFLSLERPLYPSAQAINQFFKKNIPFVPSEELFKQSESWKEKKVHRVNYQERGGKTYMFYKLSETEPAMIIASKKKSSFLLLFNAQVCTGKKCKKSHTKDCVLFENYMLEEEDD